MPEVSNDLNSVVAEAVKAKITAEVAAALSADAVMSKYVAAALTQPVEVGNGWTKNKVPYLSYVIETAVRDATKDVVREVIAENVETIRDETRKAVRRRLNTIAESFAESVQKQAESTYGITIDVKVPGRDR